MTPEITLLFLNAGRRVELIKAFRLAFNNLGIRGRIITTDINGLAPTFYFGDQKYITPQSRDSGFIERLCDICQWEKVTVIIPLIDPDLAVLAQNLETITASGARVLVSDHRVIDICCDKEKTHQFLKSNNFPTPEVFSLNDAQRQALPLFLKPRDGSSSLNTYKINDRRELEFFAGYVKGALIQEFVEGVEVTTDVFSDWAGNPIAAVPRRRLKVRSGEVSVGRVERDPVLESLCKDVARCLGTLGPVNIQTIKSDAQIHVMEINPRFGGGCPLSIAAGAPFAEWTIMMALCRPLPADLPPLQDGLTMMRFDESAFVPLDQIVS
jgi:carbamoyl-phosphate synthase large subunit